MMYLRVSYKKKYEKIIFFFTSFKSLKKGVGSGVGSGSISQRYGSGDPDPPGIRILEGSTDPTESRSNPVVSISETLVLSPTGRKSAFIKTKGIWIEIQFLWEKWKI